MGSIEYDSGKEAWNYYKRKYQEFDIDVDKVTYIDGRGKQCVKYKEKAVELSGDCMFNFNEQKVSYFKKITGLQKETIKRLEKCEEFHHSKENYVLLPSKGGLNNLKGNIYYREKIKGFVVRKGGAPHNMYDRPDTFIYYLKQYFEHRHDSFTLKTAGEFMENSVFSYAVSRTFNFEELWEVLELFENIEEFCKVFFKVDGKFVERMIKEGQMPINTDADLNRYIDLAMDFWRISNKSITV